ncbi:MAG: hypothetical protein WDN03_00605 [Rhizomicrobium sp.]
MCWPRACSTRFGAMDAGVLTFSEDFSGYHGRAADEVRVEIPSTGISIGEIDRLLRAWLGQETHVSGELVHTAKGLAVTVRYDGRPGVTAEGPADGLDTLIQTAAENMFAAVRPLRFADYLSSHNRIPEALALARGGQLAAARAIIAATRTDCAACALARGRVETAARDWAGAARRFKLVSDRSPHIPFADTDWGRMLLAKGDPGGAVAKFASAHRKGPHFADPLELWGEALIARNRSDLALAKFEEAARYAPNWGAVAPQMGRGRCCGRATGPARETIRRAATLYLTPAERAALARARHI